MEYAVAVTQLACSTVVVKSGMPSISGSILKHPGTKENGKKISRKAVWHEDRVVIDSS